MTFLDDLQKTLKEGWDFVYHIPDHYPLKFQNTSPTNDMGTGSIGGEICRFYDSEGNLLGRIDNDGFVLDRAFVGAAGEIKFGAWSSAHITAVWEPRNWLPCDGRSLVRADFARLFDALGTAYGAADGTHFNIPDLRDAVPGMVGPVVFTSRAAVGTNTSTALTLVHAHDGAHHHTYAHTHPIPHTHDHDHFHLMNTLHAHSGDTGLNQSPTLTIQQGSSGTFKDAADNDDHSHPIDPSGDAADPTEGPDTIATGDTNTANSGAASAGTWTHVNDVGGATGTNTGNALANTNVSPIQKTLPVYAIIHT